VLWKKGLQNFWWLEILPFWRNIPRSNNILNT
jgi:pta: phosphate acetyltransferase